MRRMGMVIGIRPEHIAEYRRLHAAVWPEVLARIAASHIRNYTIFLREPENLLFGYWEYHGVDFEADAAAIAPTRRRRTGGGCAGPARTRSRAARTTNGGR